MTIRSMPNSDAYRKGWDKAFGRKRVDPADTHEVVKQIIGKLQTETCRPCNETHPRGQKCPKCGRSLLLG